MKGGLCRLLQGSSVLQLRCIHCYCYPEFLLGNSVSLWSYFLHVDIIELLKKYSSCLVYYQTPIYLISATIKIMGDRLDLFILKSIGQ